MTKGWRIVDCTAMTGILRYKRGQLVIEHHDLETCIPLADTAVLLLGVQDLLGEDSPPLVGGEESPF